MTNQLESMCNLMCGESVVNKMKKIKSYKTANGLKSMTNKLKKEKDINNFINKIIQNIH